MWLNKNQTKGLFLGFFKILLMVIGLNIFLTTLLTLINLESEKNNLNSEIILNIKKS